MQDAFTEHLPMLLISPASFALVPSREPNETIAVAASRFHASLPEGHGIPCQRIVTATQKFSEYDALRSRRQTECRTGKPPGRPLVTPTQAVTPPAARQYVCGRVISRFPRNQNTQTLFERPRIYMRHLGQQ